ncbi:hypothetical protein [Halopiger xanaduensis]|nr:hypothetical protein [Halopiger xanaduensis]
MVGATSDDTTSDDAEAVSNATTRSVRQWLLLDGNRFAVAVALAVAF